MLSPFVCLLLAAAPACGGGKAPDHPEPPLLPESLARSPEPTPPYPISARGGTPATGPGDRYNHCERIFCLEHAENFFIDHFLDSHVGWILHDSKYGDVFVPRQKIPGQPDFPGARQTALYLCGRHVHPWIFGKYGGGPIRHTGYNSTLGYPRAHFQTYGTRLDPCCVNGLGSGFVHSEAGRQFRFHDLAEFRAHPEIGWQRPFAARAEATKIRVR